MTEAVTRMHCPWCTTRLNAQAAVCHRCGAIKMRPPLSMMQIFFVHPLGATILALIGFTLFGLSVVKAGGVFIAGWLLFSLIHVAFRQRRRWVQLEPLLLKVDETEQQVSHAAPFQMKPWWATAATVVVGLGIVWATTPRTQVEASGGATLSVNTAAVSTPAPAAPVNVAVVAPAREALPPTPPSQPWKVETPASEPPKVDVAAVDATKPEPPDRNLVLTAQRLLSDLGYDVGGVDGKIGSRTRASVKAFRERAGLGGEEINAGLIAALETAAPLQQYAAVAPTPAPVSETRPQRMDSRGMPLVDPFRPQAEPTFADKPMPQAESGRMQNSSTAALNREAAQKYQQPTPAERPAPTETRPQRTPVVTNEMPVNGGIVTVPRDTQAQAPVRVAAPLAQKAEATAPAQAAVPIHTLVPTIIPIQNPGSAVVDGAAIPPPPPAYPIRLGPPVRY
jgi:peptidoglycan hydrolase-like protein with peptidoglycan-binding domain